VEPHNLYEDIAPMSEPPILVTTAEQVIAVEIYEGKGLVIRLRGDDGIEHHVQFPDKEAHGLADMIALAASKLPAPAGVGRS
jgi:hypothetical protein